MSYDESYDEESNGVGIEDPKTLSPDEQQSLGEAKSAEKTPGTRTRLSDLEKFQLLNDDRIKLLDQELPRGERRLIVDQLKVGQLCRLCEEVFFTEPIAKKLPKHVRYSTFGYTIIQK